MSRLSMLSIVLLPVALAGAMAAPDVLLTDAGLKLTWGDAVLADGTLPAVERAMLETRTVDPENDRYVYTFEPAPDEPGTISVLPEEVTIQRRYAWGELRVQYTVRNDRLLMRAAIENRSDKAIANFDLRLLDLDLPDAAEAIEKHGGITSTLDRPVAIRVPAGAGHLYALCQTFHPPMHFGFAAATASAGRYPLRARGGVLAESRDRLTFPHMGLPRIEAGETLELEFALRFAAANEHRHDVLHDFYAAFREHHEPMLDWHDRRPIGMTFIMKEESEGHGPTIGMDTLNPRRLGGRDMNAVDAFSPAGQSMISRWMRQLAYSTVTTMRDMGGQGIIMWNPEGAPLGGYPGSPEMQTIWAPELSEPLDEYFRIIREAGFRTGVCIRPWNWFWNPSFANRPGWHPASNIYPHSDPLQWNLRSLIPHHVGWWEVFPTARQMSAKIAYAKKRWGATLFYVDTSQIYVPFGAEGETRNWRAHVMRADVYRHIREDHPDVLIIPEIYRGRLAYLGHVAPYGQVHVHRIAPMHGPDYTRDIFPHYFGFHVVHDSGGPDPYKERLFRLHERVWGEVLSADGWGAGTLKGQLIAEIGEQAGAAMRRATTLARRFGTLRSDKETLPFPYALESGRRLRGADLVTNPPGSPQLRATTASSADRREAMLLLAWYGWPPYAYGANLKPSLPGVELAGEHRLVWDLETGALLNAGDHIAVPPAPYEMFRALYVRSADKPAAERPTGLIMAMAFDNGLAPELGEDWLQDHGGAQTAAGAHGRALVLRADGGTAAYGVTPSWLSGTLEFDLHVDAATTEPLRLVRFQNHMDTTLSLIAHNGRAMLRLQSLERDGHRPVSPGREASEYTLSPIAHQPPRTRETMVPLPEGDAWRHVILAWDSGLFRVYLDGERVAMLADRQAMPRWRDGSLFEPGLIFGDAAPGGGQARIDSVALYDWTFADAQASGRGIGAGRSPLARADDLPPSVWLWGDTPRAARNVSVNWRHVPGGLQARNMTAILYRKTDTGLQRVAKGEVPAWDGTGTIVLDDAPEAVMTTTDAMALREQRGALSTDMAEFLDTIEQYVLEVQVDARPHSPPPHRIPLLFDFGETRVRHW